MITPMAQEATIEEIVQGGRDIVDAAVRLHSAGFDGVELAAMMSYFMASFLSRRTNWRTDRYRGSLENRTRIVTKMVTGIREQLGSDFIIGLRIAADDYMPEGQRATDAAAITGAA